MTTVSDIVRRVSDHLADPAQSDWGFDEILGWINDGVAAIYRKAPALSVKADYSFTVSPGRNELPADAGELLRVEKLLAPGMSNPRDLRPLDPMTLTVYDPEWRSTVGTPYGVVGDPNDPRAFYVYPQPSGAATATVVYRASPTKLTKPDDVIPLPVQYEPALVDFTLAQLYSKNTDVAGQADLATYHANRFEQGVA